MIIIAHRGASTLEPENTIRSFKKAEELKADMIELDVRMSEDGELVLCHDKSLYGTYSVDSEIENLSLAEIKKISNGEVPTLGEALQNISIPINIHVKVGGIERQLLEALKNFSSEVLISSSSPWTLKKIRALDENVKLGLVIGRGELHLLPIIKFLTKNIKLYSIHPKYSLISPLSLKLLKRLDKKIFVWTINSKDEYNQLEKLNVDGIFTDTIQLFK